jgi:DNA-binding transcriptional regulator YhcF (GntR family)
MTLSIDRTDFRPLQRYEQIAERLAADIRSGLLAPGERLPSERDLARSLEVSRASVREAIGALQVQGVVETRPGAGTFVVAAPPAGETPHDASPIPRSRTSCKPWRRSATPPSQRIAPPGARPTASSTVSSRR